VSAPGSTPPLGAVVGRIRRPTAWTLGAGAAVLAALAVGHVVVTAFPVDERLAASFVRVPFKRPA